MNADGRVIKVKSEMNKRMMQHLCHNGLLNSNQFAHRSVRMHEVQDAFGESGSEGGGGLKARRKETESNGDEYLGNTCDCSLQPLTTNVNVGMFDLGTFAF